VGIASDSLVALRRRWRADFRPKIATRQAYRLLALAFTAPVRPNQAVNCAAAQAWVAWGYG
jgi:hypothetical protein